MIDRSKSLYCSSYKDKADLLCPVFFTGVDHIDEIEDPERFNEQFPAAARLKRDTHLLSDHVVLPAQSGSRLQRSRRDSIVYIKATGGARGLTVFFS